MGADGIELDAKLSADGSVVVVHDATVDRTTSGSGRVSHLTLDALKRLDAGAKFDPKFAGESIPTLEEVFEAVADRLLINVELTHYDNLRDGLEYRVVALIDTHGLAERVIVSSFSPLSLRHVKQAARRIACGLLYMPDLPLFFRRAWFAPLIPGLDAHHPQHVLVDAAFVRRRHVRGQTVNVWTVNGEADMRRMVDAGVDAIMTDRPDVLKRIS